MGRRSKVKYKICAVRKAWGDDLDKYMRERAGIPRLWILTNIAEINYSNLSKLMNGDLRYSLGPLDKPNMLLEITLVLMRGFVKSAISDEEALREWLYVVCPDLLVSNAGRQYVWDNTQITLSEMDFVWPIPIGAEEVEPSLGPGAALRAGTEPISREIEPTSVSDCCDFLQVLKRFLLPYKGKLHIKCTKEAINLLFDHLA